MRLCRFFVNNKQTPDATRRRTGYSLDYSFYSLFEEITESWNSNSRITKHHLAQAFFCSPDSSSPKRVQLSKLSHFFFLFCTFTNISLSPFRGTLCVRLIVRNCMRDLRISRRRFFFFTMSYLRAKQLSNRARTGSPSLSSSHRVLSIRRWNFVKTTTLDQKNCNKEKP